MLDIILNFNKGIIIQGLFCKERKIIFKTYLKFKFIIDIIILAGFIMHNVTTKNNFFALLYIISLIKLISITDRLQSYLFLDDVLQRFLSLAKLYIRLVFFIHFFGCLWYFILHYFNFFEFIF